MRYTRSNDGKKHVEMNLLSHLGFSLKNDSDAWFICDSVEVPSVSGMAIFCSSPQEDVSRQFRKRALELTMPVWTYDELVECRNLLYSDIIDIAYLRARYSFLGGVPRLIFANINKNAVELILDAEPSSPVEKLKRLVNSSGSTPLDMVFNQLKSQFEAFVPRETWSTRVKEEYDLAFNSKLLGLFDF